MGSLPTHTRAGVEYLVKRVFPRVLTVNPAAELHLFGGGTEAYHQPQHCVHGHGFYSEKGLPFAGDALFTVPDLLGGGIKIKTGDLLRENVPFITTPFGAEGYHIPDDPSVFVCDIDLWAHMLSSYFCRLFPQEEACL